MSTAVDIEGKQKGQKQKAPFYFNIIDSGQLPGEEIVGYNVQGIFDEACEVSNDKDTFQFDACELTQSVKPIHLTTWYGYNHGGISYGTRIAAYRTPEWNKKDILAKHKILSDYALFLNTFACINDKTGRQWNQVIFLDKDWKPICSYVEPVSTDLKICETLNRRKVTKEEVDKMVEELSSIDGLIAMTMLSRLRQVGGDNADIQPHILEKAGIRKAFRAAQSGMCIEVNGQQAIKNYAKY